jgi:alkaline phosphatase
MDQECEKCVPTEKQNVDVRMGGGREKFTDTVNMREATGRLKCIQNYIEEEIYGGNRRLETPRGKG